MLYIILPTYNERENIASLLRAIASLGLPSYRVLVIDDNSPDGTSAAVAALTGELPVELITRSGKLGLGSAYVLGFTTAMTAGADMVMEMDADFSHDPQDIPRLVAAITAGADLAIGSRRIAGGGIRGWNWWRRLMSRGAMEFSRLVLNLRTRDVTAGFRCYRTSLLQSVPLDKIKSNGYSFQEEMIFYVEKIGGRVTEVPVIFRDRQRGASKMSAREIINFFIVMFKLRFSHVPQSAKKS